MDFIFFIKEKKIFLSSARKNDISTGTPRSGLCSGEGDKYLISLVFPVRTVNYGSSFFPSIYGLSARLVWSLIYSAALELG